MKLDHIRVSAALAAAACMVPSVAFAEEGGATRTGSTVLMSMVYSLAYTASLSP